MTHPILFLLLACLSSQSAARDFADSLALSGENRAEIAKFAADAQADYGEIGQRAAHFLICQMPERDLLSLSAEFLRSNLSFALKAREEFSWAAEVPEDVFFNDVLPYASLDETREDWRPSFFEKASAIVKNCTTPTEAAQALNREFFKLIDVHYNTGRKRPNQSPSESIELKIASCTGLSILLVDACRAVGVPARIAGTAAWTNKQGNHTWVEIWDNGTWHFTGADEFDPKGLNRAWFVKDASKAIENEWQHAIWASSWQHTGHFFPLVWNLQDRSIPAVNVTSRYVSSNSSDDAKGATVYFRMIRELGGERLPARLHFQLGNESKSLTTKAGTTDFNDMPSLALPQGKHEFSAEFEGEIRTGEFLVAAENDQTVNLVWSELKIATAPADADIDAKLRNWLALPPDDRGSKIPTDPLSKEEAEHAVKRIADSLKNEVQKEREAELAARVVRAAGLEMKLLEATFGDAPAGKRSLWISMHGGGGAPTQVNDQQWQNQIRLYRPKEGIVVAPRAPTDTWNLWHQSHIDQLFDRLIENYVIARGVDPNRVYLMGYSAGGDGVYQLAPRMADRFAAASMMAGHPNDASPLGLRNLPFMIFMGGEDKAFKRNEVAAEWGEKLSQLRKADPAGYLHQVTIYEGLGHWMQLRDAEALPWMSEHNRNPWPAKVVWNRHKKIHTRFYWLQVSPELKETDATVRAEISGQEINIQVEGDLRQLTLRLRDELLNLDEPVKVIVNEKVIFEDKVPRSLDAIFQSLSERLDPNSAATARLLIHW